MERRHCSTQAAPVGIETRADGSPMIVGYGSVFYKAGEAGTEYELWRGVKERISPDAFTRALADKDDARGLFNHDANHLLGRVAAGTMRLSVDAVGLRYEIDPPDTQAGRDVVASIQRGDLSGSSFAFSVGKESWQEMPDGSEVRTIEEVSHLYDTGPVTYPAYEAAHAGIRSDAGVDGVLETDSGKSHAAWRQSLREDQEAKDETRRARINRSADAIKKLS